MNTMELIVKTADLLYYERNQADATNEYYFKLRDIWALWKNENTEQTLYEYATKLFKDEEKKSKPTVCQHKNIVAEFMGGGFLHVCKDCGKTIY